CRRYFVGRHGSLWQLYASYQIRQYQGVFLFGSCANAPGSLSGSALLRSEVSGTLRSTIREVCHGRNQLSALSLSIESPIMSQRKSRLTLNQYVEGVLQRDRLVLSRAITLVESSLNEDQLLA